MDFEKRKIAMLAALGSTETDKSPKGTLDVPIIPLLSTINQHPCYFTTSSCSGRISILYQPSLVPNSSYLMPKKKARGGSWLYITHDPADPNSVIDLLFPSDSTQSTPFSDETSEFVFRFEPLIIAVECKDLSSAQSLVSAAISCGFRESGISSVSKRVIIAIRCSIRLEVPLGNTQKILVSPDYVRYLIEIANEKMEANRKRTEGFLKALKCINVENSNGLLSNGAVDRENSALACDDVQVEVGSQLDERDEEAHSGPSLEGDAKYDMSIIQMAIVGEPMEKLFLWGHSACNLDGLKCNEILVFGGFGGMGRHTRRNDCLLLDTSSAALKTLATKNSPTPRLGHTSSLVGKRMFVIGGRTDPVEILNDVWILDIENNYWKLLIFDDSEFAPRHRHAAAVIGSKIYIFGGLKTDVISSSFYVLETINLEWKELPIDGDRPCARHSHAMIAYNSKIYMFGGYNGEKALGDLYSFDIETCKWMREKTAGRNPHARFSHSMFIYKNYLGILGGCPVRQYHQELALLDLQHHVWKYITLSSIGKHLFVRSSVNLVGDELIVLGGGASCYAFGTKFSEPVKINMNTLKSADDSFEVCKNRRKKIAGQENGTINGDADVFQGSRSQTEHVEDAIGTHGLHSENELPIINNENQMSISCYILQIGKQNAKLGKDILKKFSWLDLGRKVCSQKDGAYIGFPVTEKFCAVFNNQQHFSGDASEEHDREERLWDKICISEALKILKDFGVTLLVDEIVKVRKAVKSPLTIMNEAVAALLNNKGLPLQLLEELPSRWEKLGDIVILPSTSFNDHVWNSVAEELWPTVAKAFNTHRLARQGRVAPTGTRDSTLQILLGDNGWVDHRENGIIYCFDASKCMFSWGNLSEKLRMSRLDCKDEIVVDMFAGIGYFVLPFLVRANARLVYACEWNTHAVQALQRNLQANGVGDRCIILEGDNQIMAPKGVADRVCLGLIPSSEASWATAVRALRKEGGMLHVHGNAKDSEESQWTEHVVKSICEIARFEGYDWEVSLEHVERVKWYAPHIRHLVADVRCRERQK